MAAGLGPYSCTKAAIECMVKGMAKELAGRKITINAIAPGPVNTQLLYNSRVMTPEMIGALTNFCPFGRLGETKDIAPMVLFLVSDEAEWVHGQTIKLAGGL
jgi:3-oxoacyl-[acyl-carrier protein] reductase